MENIKALLAEHNIHLTEDQIRIFASEIGIKINGKTSAANAQKVGEFIVSKLANHSTEETLDLVKGNQPAPQDKNSSNLAKPVAPSSELQAPDSKPKANLSKGTAQNYIDTRNKQIPTADNGFGDAVSHLKKQSAAELQPIIEEAARTNQNISDAVSAYVLHQFADIPNATVNKIVNQAEGYQADSEFFRQQAKTLRGQIEGDFLSEFPELREFGLGGDK